MHFTDRPYLYNKIWGSTQQFTYDANGNLVDEGGHDGLPHRGYSFTPENQLVRVTGAQSGLAEMQAAYDESGNRWVRQVWSAGSVPLITLRDASGKVVTEFSEDTASSGLRHVRDYIYAGSQLVAANSYCGPRPDLELGTTLISGGNVNLKRIDHIQSTTGYTVLIKGSAGQSTLHLPAGGAPEIATNFTIPVTALGAGTNLVSIQSETACGVTGYSNAVAVNYGVSPPSPPGAGQPCMGSLAVARAGFSSTAGGDSLKVFGQGNCATGTMLDIWYFDGESFGVIGQQLWFKPFVLWNQPNGTGHGTYYLTIHDDLLLIPTGPPVDFGPGSDDPDPGGGSLTLPPTVNAQFYTWDHLGSTRLLTDEAGVVIGHWKYYPFGQEAEASATVWPRHRFTGHERDAEVGLDYMLARSHSPGLCRFLSPDPLAESIKPILPSTWNRYSYVLNTPVNAIDPSGLAEVLVNNPKDTQHFEAELEAVAGPGISISDGKMSVDDSKLGNGQDYSSEARDQVKEVSSDATPGTLLFSLNTNMSPQDAPGAIREANPAPSGVQGPTMVVVEVNGQAGTSATDSRGAPIISPSPIVLIHEMVAAKNRLQGTSPGPTNNAVTIENVVRSQLGLPQRAAEPTHPD